MNISQEVENRLFGRLTLAGEYQDDICGAWNQTEDKSENINQIVGVRAEGEHIGRHEEDRLPLIGGEGSRRW